MKRSLYLVPILLAGPAIAHVAGQPHFHETDKVSLGLGIGLLVAGLACAWFVRDRNP